MGEKRYVYLESRKSLDSRIENNRRVAFDRIRSFEIETGSCQPFFFSPTGQVGPASNYSRRNHVTIVRIRERHLA